VALTSTRQQQPSRHRRRHHWTCHSPRLDPAFSQCFFTRRFHADASCRDNTMDPVSFPRSRGWASTPLRQTRREGVQEEREKCPQKCQICAKKLDAPPATNMVVQDTQDFFCCKLLETGPGARQSETRRDGAELNAGIWMGDGEPMTSKASLRTRCGSASRRVRSCKHDACMSLHARLCRLPNQSTVIRVSELARLCRHTSESGRGHAACRSKPSPSLHPVKLVKDVMCSFRVAIPRSHDILSISVSHGGIGCHEGRSSPSPNKPPAECRCRCCCLLAACSRVLQATKTPLRVSAPTAPGPDPLRSGCDGSYSFWCVDRPLPPTRKGV